MRRKRRQGCVFINPNPGDESGYRAIVAKTRKIGMMVAKHATATTKLTASIRWLPFHPADRRRAPSGFDPSQAAGQPVISDPPPC